jgi:hydrogenase maturation protease
MNEKILILGIGNVLMGDEGVGVDVIRYLEKELIPANVVLLDGGTGGFHLLESLIRFSIIIMIDATLDGGDEGTIKLIEPKFSSDFPKALSAHDIGLKDLVEALILLEKFPKIYLFTISVKEIQSMVMELSPKIMVAVPIVAQKIIDLIKKLNQEI